MSCWVLLGGREDEEVVLGELWVLGSVLAGLV